MCIHGGHIDRLSAAVSTGDVATVFPIFEDSEDWKKVSKYVF